MMPDSKNKQPQQQAKKWAEAAVVSEPKQSPVEHGLHPILQMQQTVGNQVVQRWLSQETGQIAVTRLPKGGYTTSIKHYARANTLASRSGDGSAASAAGSSFDPNAVVDGQTADQLDQILSNSQYLQPYIQDKLKSKKIAAAGKFIIYDSDSEFDVAYMTLHHKMDQRDNPAFKKELELKKGFYFPPDDTIHLRPQADKAQAMHEAIHKFTEPGYRSFFGKYVDEGTTQFFADKVQAELGLPPGGSHGYGPELVFATQLIAYLGETFAAEQFFKDFDGPTMLNKIGLTLPEYDKKYRYGEEAKAQFLKYLRKLV